MESRMTFTIEGKSPLLTHNPASMSRPKTGGTKGREFVYDPDEEALGGLYIDGDKKYCFPGIGVRNSIIRAAGDWKSITGKKRGSLTSTVAHIIVEPELIPILDHKGKPVKTYEVDQRRAVVQKQGVIRARPKFTEWRLTFEIVFDDDIIPMSVEEVRTMFQGLLGDAGKRVGIGDYRPIKTGWFGTFGCLNGKK